MKPGENLDPVKNYELALLDWLLLILNNKKPIRKNESTQFFSVTITDLNRLKNVDFTEYTKNLNRLGIKIKTVFDFKNEHPEAYLNRKKYGAIAEDYFDIGEIEAKNLSTLKSSLLLAKKYVLGVREKVSPNDYIFNKEKLSIFTTENKKDELFFDISTIEGRILKQTYFKYPSKLSWDEFYEEEDFPDDLKYKKAFQDACGRINTKFKEYFEEQIDLIKYKKGESFLNIDFKSE